MTLQKEIENLRNSLVQAERIETELDRRVFYLKTLYDVSKDIFSSVEYEPILKNFLLMTMGNFGVVEGFILTMDMPTKEINGLASMGFKDTDDPRLKAGDMKLLLSDVREGAVIEGKTLRKYRSFPKSVVCALPFIIDSDTSGVLGLGPKLVGDPYNNDDTELLVTLMNNLVVALKNARSFEEIKNLNKDLQQKNRDLIQAYHELQEAQAVLIEKERLECELELARELQQSILPHEFPDLKKFSFAARSRPARQVGGDFYDVIQLSRGRVGLIMADVSDKGMSAALYMALTRSLIHAEAKRSSSPRKVLPRKVLLNVHRLLLDMSSQADMFVTVVYGVLDPAKGNLRYTRAGHDRPLLFSPTTNEWRFLTGKGTVLGFVEEVSLEEVDVDLHPGDLLIFYTDGITDANSPAGEFFGSKRLRETVCAAGGLGADDMCDHIFEHVDQFQTGAVQHDDMALLVVKVDAGK